MIYTGSAVREIVSTYHPTGKSFWRFGTTGTYLKDPADPKSRTVASYEDMYQIFGGLLDRKANNQVRDFRTAISLPAALPREFYPTVTSYTGEFVKVPAQHTFKFPNIRSNNQPAYSQAKDTDNIVVSDYQKGTMTVTYTPRYVFSWRTLDRYDHQELHRLLGVEKPSDKNPVIYAGRTWVAFPNIRTDKYYCKVTEEPCESTFKPDVLMEQILTGCIIDPNVVTTAVADANAGTVDLATSLAEMPLFAKSVLNGVMLIIKAYKDAKRRDFRLKDRVSKVKADYDKAISRLDAKDAAGLKTAQNQQIKDVNNLLHEISSVWLNYRLNILPTAMTVENSIDGLVFGAASAKFIRVRNSQVINIETGYGVLSARHRATIKRSLKPTAEWQGFFTVNLTRTAWELVPLSFVLDRYINIGQWITANLSSPTDYTSAEGSTVSWLIKDAVTTPCAVIDINLYKRSVFSSGSYCQLTFPRSRTRDQSLDHLALAWSILIKKV